MQTTAFEVNLLDMLATLELLPMPVAVAFDRDADRVEGNAAFRRLQLDARRLPALQRAAREATEAADGGMYAWPLRDGDGGIHGSIAVFLDVRETRETERRYRLIADAMPQFVWIEAANGGTLYTNSRWLDYTGLTEDETGGYGWERVVHPDDLKRLHVQRRRAAPRGEPYETECRYRGKDGKYRWFLFRSIPVRNDQGAILSWLATATDIDKQKRAEAQQAFFALASDVLGSTLDVSTTLERIARLAVASMGTWCQIDIPDARGRLRVAVVAHQDANKEARLSQLVNHNIYNDSAQAGPPAVLSTMKPQLLHQVDEEAVEYVIPAQSHRAIYHEIGYTSGVMVPLRTRDRVLGVLGIASDDPTRLYTEFDVTTALELGRRGAIALENAQSFAREHRVASTLQRALLPAGLPQLESVSFDSDYAAAASGKGEAVGGDWYDAFMLDDARVAVSVGDVTGHGVDAAVTMSVVRQAIRTAALEHRNTAQVLSRASASLMLDHRSTMTTAIFAIYDCETREFAYSIAGHPRPLLAGADGTFLELDAAGMPLGEIFDLRYVEERKLTLPDAEAAIVFYTDGLVEYARDILSAVKRLETTVRERTFLRSAKPAAALIEAVLGGRPNDDVAVLVMRVGERAAPVVHSEPPDQK